jgi:hypothetical protein
LKKIKVDKKGAAPPDRLGSVIPSMTFTMILIAHRAHIPLRRSGLGRQPVVHNAPSQENEYSDEEHYQKKSQHMCRSLCMARWMASPDAANCL